MTLIDRVRSWFGRPPASKLQRITDLQRRSDVVLIRAKRAQEQAERDRIASAVSNTVSAVRRGHRT